MNRRIKTTIEEGKKTQNGKNENRTNYERTYHKKLKGHCAAELYPQHKYNHI